MTALPLILLLLGQAPSIAPDAQVRALTVTILDDEGEPVEGLAVEDVALTENGVVRPITSFKPDERPLTVAVIVDTSQAVGNDFRLNMVDAVGALVARLPAGTSYALWTTGDRPSRLLDYTEDRTAAAEALLRVPTLGGNYMLDALAEASKDLKESMREGDRSAVIAISGTGPELSYLDKWRSADVAEENADLYLLLQIDVGGAGFQQRANLSYVFDRLARSSAGEYDAILSFMGIDSALRNLSPYLKAGYRLAYATVPDLDKRKIEVEVARPGTEVRVPVRTDVEAELEPEL
jgi:VWFA-related protein